MLTIRDIRTTLGFISLYSRLHYLPIRLNKETARIKLERSSRKILAWKVTAFLATCHAVYLDIRLLQCALYPKQLIVPEHIHLHCLNACFDTAGAVIAYFTFVKSPEVIVAIFNQLYHADNGQEELHGKLEKKSSTTQEMVMKTLAVHFLCAALGGFSMFIQDKSRIQLLFSLVSKEYQNNLTFWVIFIGESYVYMYANACTVFVFFVQLSFFEKLNHEMKEMADNLRDVRKVSRGNVEECFQSCRKFFLLIQLFNISQSYIIFGFKMVCLTLSIVMLYSGLLYIHINGILGVHNILLGFMFAQVYMVVYDKAFKIPPELATLKREMAVALKVAKRKEGSPSRLGRNNGGSRKANLEALDYLTAEKKIRSVPIMGIQVGSFHQLERESTPNFLDFVTTQVTSLLITFK